MNAMFAVLVGGLFGVGVYLMLRRTTVQLLLGLALVGNATNLLIFAAGGVVRDRAPVTPPGLTAPPSPHADPVPQALVLTAIVIAFGVLAFALALTSRTHQELEPSEIEVE